jgi:hypothetical protein
VTRRTKSARDIGARFGLKRFWSAIVECSSLPMFLPQAEPAPCAGQMVVAPGSGMSFVVSES